MQLYVLQILTGEELWQLSPFWFFSCRQMGHETFSQPGESFWK